MKRFSKFLATLLAVPMLAFSSAASANAELALDKAPINSRDTISLQRGAQLFTNYCLSCHSANAMRYNRLQDIGLTEDQIKANLMFASDKIGNTMQVAMQPKDGGAWLGVVPPDLSVIARARGADWLYTYLRTFYRDDARPTGWNNTTFPLVAMPHVLWEMQGEQVLDPKTHKLTLVKPGSLTKVEGTKFDNSEYDKRVSDLVNYIVFMGEPSQNKRETIGYVVVLFLVILLLPMAYFLKKEYWKDIH